MFRHYIWQSCEICDSYRPRFAMKFEHNATLICKCFFCFGEGGGYVLKTVLAPVDICYWGRGKGYVVKTVLSLVDLG